MNVKQIEKPIPTVHFKDIEIGEIFQMTSMDIYLVKTEPFMREGRWYNAMVLRDTLGMECRDEYEVIPCQHQINVWY